MFKTRLNILTVALALAFLVIAGRLWQLQVSRFEKYSALASRDKNAETVVPAARGQIVDRFGSVLAEDRPFFDLSVRTDRLQLKDLSVKDVKAVHALFPPGPERDARLAQMAQQLRDDPFVRGLAATLHRGEDDLAAGILKALDAVARNWAGPRTPVRIAGGIDEKTWLQLRALHEDVFRDSHLLYGAKADQMPDTQEPPFPGLVCTVSAHRVYPNGRLACFILGYPAELTPDDEDALRQDGTLLENEAARGRAWAKLRDNLSDDAAAQLERVLRTDPREIEDVGSLYDCLAKLRPNELQLAGRLGLADPVRWVERPPRMKLVESEQLWLGVGLPASTRRNALPDRIIGEAGVERYQNDLLRGKSGIKLPEADDDDPSPLTPLPQGARGTGAHAGDALALTLSTAWQHAVERALSAQNYCGGAVVIDVHSGEVLALASWPNFDPNVLVPPRDGPQRQAQIKAWLADPAKPFLNRAISEQYPLGSVMKTIVAAVALQLGRVNTTETLECTGALRLGNQIFHCDDHHAHGTVNIYGALCRSCNIFFHQIEARVGVENLGPYAKLILGRRTGIDLPGEAAGIFPDKEWRAQHEPGSVWTTGNEYLLGIGQGQMTCTVLQAAVLMAAVANGGYVVTPRVWLDGPQRAPVFMGIDARNWAVVREGMEEAVNNGQPGSRGTGYAAFHEGPELAVRVAGKTSTAEHGHDAKPDGWFAGYAPAGNPQIAFAVMLEDSGHGGVTAAPVAYKFLKEIYGTRDAPKANPGGPAENDGVAAGE